MKNSHRLAWAARLLLVLALTAGCALLDTASVGASAKKKVLAPGTWGGENISLEVSETGANVEFDCAHGQISEPIMLNKNSDFEAAGTFTPEHGGPISRDESSLQSLARYSGHVSGETMSLTITRGKEEKVGTFTLTRGAHPALRKCR